MKCVKTSEKIVVLENVKAVEFEVSGSGAKSNPHNYSISIKYLGGDTERLRFADNKKEAEQMYENIFHVISAE